ncbi:helix-turn-helix DNA binding protein [Arthrobacter phage Mufasa8]|uniref:Helix-turn-helix DNA binding protein n=1 Tax=Arthrobacter phage Mufasa8 TaxID=2656526 RepID=A0A649VPA7_9CAUD|nr:helix-turn-helix DNA binding protein [Arthrobacter phage Mufasa8]QGJ93503.1 helix-turn-helix DNA binding protein [Arthrobacter phage Mufasa8]
MAQLTKTRATLLSTEDTKHVADAVKLLAASKGFRQAQHLYEAAARNGYPGSVASLRRMLNGNRPAQEAEVVALARAFGVTSRDLIGHGAARPKLIEFDLPAAPREPVQEKPRKAKPGKLTGDDLRELATAISELTQAVRGLVESQQEAPAKLRSAS